MEEGGGTASQEQGGVPDSRKGGETGPIQGGEVDPREGSVSCKLIQSILRDVNLICVFVSVFPYYCFKSL